MTKSSRSSSNQPSSNQPSSKQPSSKQPSSKQLSNLRRQPKQQRSKDRVESILDAAAAVFDRVGYEAATTHLIAIEAGTAIGSLYQFFPDKAAIFQAMELRHYDRVKAMWAATDIVAIAQLPLRQMIHLLVAGVSALFEQPVSRVVFIQFFVARQIFQSIDDGMTQEAINFMASILHQRQPQLPPAKLQRLAEVCVTSSNALTLSVLRNPDATYQQSMTQEIEDLIVAYLEPHMGDELAAKVMKVMKCIHCRSAQLSKNGYRRGKQCYLCKDCGKQFVQSEMPL
jgi:AcrR family transcriptional regulator